MSYTQSLSPSLTPTLAVLYSQHLSHAVRELSPGAADALTGAGALQSGGRQVRASEEVRLLQPRHGHDGRPADRSAHLRDAAVPSAREVVRTLTGGEYSFPAL